MIGLFRVFVMELIQFFMLFERTIKLFMAQEWYFIRLKLFIIERLADTQLF